MDSENDKLSIKESEYNYRKFIEEPHEPQIRHKYEIRKYIRNNGGIVDADELLDFMRERYGYTDKILTKMLLRLEEQNVIMALFVNDEFDLKYANYKEKYFD